MQNPEDLMESRWHECTHECADPEFEEQHHAAICLPCAKGAAYDCAVMGALAALEEVFEDVVAHKESVADKTWNKLMENVLDDIRALYWRVRYKGVSVLSSRKSNLKGLDE